MAERTRRRATGSGGSSRRSARSAAPEGRLSRDYSSEDYREPDEGYDGPEPTRGLYTAELVRITDHESQEGNESVRWLFRLVKGSVNADGEDVGGWMDSQYTTENTAWREQQMLVALGVIKPNGKVNLPYDGIVKKAKPCTVKVGVERYIPEDGGEGQWRGRMQAFLPLRDSTAERRGTTKRQNDDVDDEDVFEEEEQEEQEEPPPARSRRSTSRSRRKAEPEPDEDEEEESEEEEGDEDEEDYDPDALAAELEDMTLAALKKRARDEFGVSVKRGMDADDIIEAVLDTLGDEDAEDAEDEEEEEEPPPPPKRSTRSRQAASRSKSDGGKTRSRRARGSSEDPPF